MSISDLKAAYFWFTRRLLVEHSHNTHLEATENYREAKEFAKWSLEDREERLKGLPPLTSEQKQQVKAYLRIMQQHHACNPDSEKPSD